MKRFQLSTFNFQLLSVVCFFFLAAACSGDDTSPEVAIEPGAPRITFTEQSYTLPEGAPATITGTVVSNSALVSVKYFLVSGASETALSINYTSETSYNFSQVVTPTATTTGFKVAAKNIAGEEAVAVAAIARKIDEEKVNNLTVSPKNNARAAYIDTYLSVEFASAPTLGDGGIIAIYKTDGTKVDEINLADAQPRLENNGIYNTTKIDLLACSDRVRAVNYKPAVIKGNTLLIKPHFGALQYNTEYYVTIDAAAVQGVAFEGITANQWKFTTKSSVPAAAVTVDDDGEADFRTIQAAIAWSESKGKDVAVTINVKNGTYEELLFVRNKNNLTIKGESRDGVVVAYDNCDAWNGGTGGSIARPEAGGVIATAGGRSVFLIESCDLLRIENMTLINTHGAGNQAEVFYFNSSYRLSVVNCNLRSNQDTINIKGYCWFYNTLVAGDVDFIWGGAAAALFEQCEIRSVTGGGYILQARVPNATDKGFVFLNCELTKAAGVTDNSTHLARSAGNAAYYDNIAFILCKMDTHITAAGWHSSPAPNPVAATALSGWKEYGSKDMSGAALSINNRLQPGSYQLSESEYTAGYGSRAIIFAGYGDAGWIPE
jgi:pectin methylesterase-like acyl-CoA thioesterase